jgi:hypothetical protein
MRSIRFLPLVLLLACGDNEDNTRPDARRDGPPADAPIDAPQPLVCGFTEMADTTNDDLFGNGTAEATGLNFTTSTMVICGKLDNGHYEVNPQRVDVDSYRFSVPANTQGLLYLTAPGAENFDSVLIEIYGMTTNTSETGKYIGNFAVASAALPAGDYVVTVSSYDATVPAAALNYRLIMMLDSPTRCAKSTATPAYMENIDGLTADGNDVIEVRYSGQPRRKLTDSGLDMPEPTGIMVAPNMSYRITGTSASPAITPASWADSFQERDVYQIAMGAMTNQLSVRLNWPGTTADYDFFVFPMGGVIEQATGWYAGNMEDEFTTLAVTPGMSYWIWLGVDDASTGLPINYDLTVCGGTFTSPP